MKLFFSSMCVSTAPPKPTLRVEPQRPVSTGETVTLKCVIESLSKWTYKWYKDRNNNVVFEGNNFTITRVTASDEGRYWCQGVRGERPTSSQLSDSVDVGVDYSMKGEYIHISFRWMLSVFPTCG